VLRPRLPSRASAACLGLAVVASGLAAMPQSAQRPPNVVLLLADDLGPFDLGCYGGELIGTPHVDALAAEGLRFLEHYAGSPYCAPSRCTLLTGKHTGHADIRGNNVAFGIEEETLTLAELLRAAGYATGCFGKWGMGEGPSPGEPLRHGFDRFVGLRNEELRAQRYYPNAYVRDDELVPLPDNVQRRAVYIQDLFVDEAERFIREHAAQPFFVYLPFCLPHAPLDVPPDSIEPFAGRFDPETPFPGDALFGAQPRPHAAFAGMVRRLDDYVGRITALLDELGLAERTLVLFTSDNGPTAAGGADPGFFHSAGPYRGIKGKVYEGGIRTPMIARWKGTIAPGGTSDHLSAFWDVLPTCAELAGVAPPDDVDGLSFVPTLVGEPARQEHHAFLYWELVELGMKRRLGLQALRQGSWKLVGTNVQQKPRWELFDLAADPSESNDLAATKPAVVDRLKKLLRKARVANPNFPLLPKEQR